MPRPIGRYHYLKLNIMKSKITIEVDFENGNMPVIQILSRNSDDVRDRLLNSFLQNLHHTSRWCRIIYDGTCGVWADNSPMSDDAGHRWKIETIKPSELPEEVKLMETTYRDAFPSKQ